MRPFEFTLILLNLLSLALSFRKQPRKLWLLLAALNGAALALHSVFEGFRYQMLFSYISVLVFAIYAFLKTRPGIFETRAPRWVRIAAVCITLAFLLLTSALAYALPVFSLPVPSGMKAVTTWSLPISACSLAASGCAVKSHPGQDGPGALPGNYQCGDTGIY